MPTQRFKRSYSAATSEDFSKHLSDLSESISEIQKEISYLDVYNITVAVSDPSQLESTISALAPGSALVVNFTTSYVSGGRTYKMGDVVLKTVLGEEVFISSQVGGTYFPAKITKNGNNFTLLFQYYGSQPVEGEITTLNLNEDWEENQPPTKEIQFNLENTTTESMYYGFIEELPLNKSSFSFKASKYTDPETKQEILVEPMLKFFIGSSKTSVTEEIEFSYSLVYDNTNWVVTIADDKNPRPKMTVYCVVK